MSLIAAGMAAIALFGFSVPVAIGIVILLTLLAFSYRQTIMEYPGGGGAYIVAKENLGEMAAQTAGASLLIDYILTVAVSASRPGWPPSPPRCPPWTGYNVVLTLPASPSSRMANLRGVKESGRLFAIPTYGFIACMMVLLAIGFGRWVLGVSGWSRPGPGRGRPRGHGQPVGGPRPDLGVHARLFARAAPPSPGWRRSPTASPRSRTPPAGTRPRPWSGWCSCWGPCSLGITVLSQHFGVTYHHSVDASGGAGDPALQAHPARFWAWQRGPGPACPGSTTT